MSLLCVCSLHKQQSLRTPDLALDCSMDGWMDGWMYVCMLVRMAKAQAKLVFCFTDTGIICEYLGGSMLFCRPKTCTDMFVCRTCVTTLNPKPFTLTVLKGSPLVTVCWSYDLSLPASLWWKNSYNKINNLNTIKHLKKIINNNDNTGQGIHKQ